MSDSLSALHDAHNSCLSLEATLHSDTLVRFLVLGLSFLELNLIDLDAILGMVKVGIEGKCVGCVDIPTLGMLGERSKFGAGERLKGSIEISLG